ncbi:hypothetical protein BH11CYA1_BH11CYA1_30010 [soil metagenome]
MNSNVKATISIFALLNLLLSPTMAMAKADPDPFLPPVNNPSGSREGWIVRQRGYQWGGCVWYITDQQIKMSGSFLCMIINRKTKRITLYSLKSNRFRTYGLHECAKRIGIYRARQRYVFGPVKVVGTADYLGQPATTMVRIGQRITDSNAHKNVEFRDDIIVSKKIKFDSDINETLESVLYSVYSYGLPFKMIRSGYIKGRESRSTQSVVLTEVHFVKARAIPDKEFALPKGLKPSQTEMDLLSSDMEINQL